MKLKTHSLVLELLTAIKEATDATTLKQAGEELRNQLILTEIEQKERETFLDLQTNHRAILDSIEVEKAHALDVVATAQKEHADNVAEIEANLTAENTRIQTAIKGLEARLEGIFIRENTYARQVLGLQHATEQLKQSESNFAQAQTQFTEESAALRARLEDLDTREEKIKAQEARIRGFQLDIKV